MQLWCHPLCGVSGSECQEVWIEVWRIIYGTECWGSGSQRATLYGSIQRLNYSYYSQLSTELNISNALRLIGRSNYRRFLIGRSRVTKTQETTTPSTYVTCQSLPRLYYVINHLPFLITDCSRYKVPLLPALVAESYCRDIMASFETFKHSRYLPRYIIYQGLQGFEEGW